MSVLLTIRIIRGYQDVKLVLMFGQIVPLLVQVTL